ncbi:DUF3307 domain-containing protein [Kitasatospora sp. NPDC093550]|uniref:DUF3307 domain-containing protein n=1 Tax=Kitasatospora sp. NPDC093550 TaxID=3364089 RepID=UPI00381A8385
MTALFAAVFALLYVAHHLSDYPFQTDHQAQHKAGHGPIGWRALGAHAGTHVVTSLVLLMLGEFVLGFHLSPAAAVVAPLWLGVSHAAIDRRWPVARWMVWARQQGFAEHGGAAHVDQSAHLALGVLPAALLIAGLS